MSPSCITYPSDQRAQHEFIQRGQKNSTFHRESRLVRDKSQQNIPAVSIKRRLLAALQLHFPHKSAKRSAPFKSPEIPSHPSHLKLVENFLSAFSLADASGHYIHEICQFNRHQVSVETRSHPHFVPQHHTHPPWSTAAKASAVSSPHLPLLLLLFLSAPLLVTHKELTMMY